MHRHTPSTVGLAILVCLSALAAEDDLLSQAKTAMRKAGTHWAEKVASHGGFVWE